MNNKPNKRQLRSLLFACNDLAGRHILWVNRVGEVQITRLGVESSEEWDERMVSQVQFRSEIYEPGNNYVGIKAANNDEYVSHLFDHLLIAWNDGRRGIIPLDNNTGSQTP